MKTLATLAKLVVFAAPLMAQERIEDNSFIIEEAYNQERGIVQHISTFARASGGDWEYTFTQEWPFLGQQNQLSYSIPVASLSNGVGGSRTRFGDIALNYRRQLLGIGGGNVALSPRLSLLLPTGNEETGHGAGGIGLQANVPMSIVLSDRVVTHYNAGITHIPSARNPLGAEASTTGYHLGGSFILLVTPSLNLMLEGLWTSDEEVLGTDLTGRFEEAFVNPGFRYAFNTRGGLQIVPGIAYMIGVGPSQGEEALFFYLSFEHAFRQTESQD